jgi:hypothetical protein
MIPSPDLEIFRCARPYELAAAADWHEQNARDRYLTGEVGSSESVTVGQLNSLRSSSRNSASTLPAYTKTRVTGSDDPSGSGGSGNDLAMRWAFLPKERSRFPGPPRPWVHRLTFAEWLVWGAVIGTAVGLVAVASVRLLVSGA